MGKRNAWFIRMKAATRDLILMCGGIEGAAEITGLSVAMIGKCNNFADDSLLNPRAKASLEAHCGDPVVTRVEAELLGFEVCRSERRPVTTTASVHDSVAQISIEAAEVMRAYAEGCADGRFSPADALQVQKELTDLARAVNRGLQVGAGLCALGGGASDD